MRSSLLLSLLLAIAPACQRRGPGPRPPTTEAPLVPDPAFDELAASLLEAHLEHRPADAVELGHHQYDGRLRDVSDDGLKLEIARLDEALAQLDAFDPARLVTAQRVEHGTLKIALQGQRFDLEVRRLPWRSPLFYMDDLELVAYVGRDYAPAPQRAAAVIAVAKGAAAHLAHADDNLEAALPYTFLDTGLLQVRGTIEFCRTDVPAAFAEAPELSQEDRDALDAALAEMIEALQTFAAALEARQAKATDDFALGPELFVAMLEHSEGISIDLPRLRTLAEEDLQRNLDALQQAAARLDPELPVARVVAQVLAQKPEPDAVLDTATAQVQQLQQVLVDFDLVSIPSGDPIQVRPTPPFMRWNSAFLDPAGAFETEGQPSFYYITPPDPAWPPEQQREYVPSVHGLMFTSVHEVWPGHFLHHLHLRQVQSPVLRTFWNYVTGEGWAHYGEQLLWESGWSDDPALHIGQLENALLRNVRFVSALGLHTEGMSVAESTLLFRAKAFQDAASAQQQAVRGTFDPMYLAYTLGKLGILALREDVRAKVKAEGGTFSLREFHDALLRHGAAPLPVIRASMLGDDAGPVL